MIHRVVGDFVPLPDNLRNHRSIALDAEIATDAEECRLDREVIQQPKEFRNGCV